MNKGVDPASCEAAREQLIEACGQLLRDAPASSVSLGLVDWYMYASVILGSIAILLHLFGGARAKATEHRLRAHLVSAADAARSAELEAAERQRARDLANAEMDRLWSLKHGGR